MNMIQSGHRVGVANMLYLILATLLTGCDAVPSTSAADSGVPDEPRYGFVGSPRGNASWSAIEAGARRYAARIRKIKLEFSVPDDDSNASVERAVRQIVQLKPHVACLCVRNTPQYAEHVRTLVNAGIIVITVGDALDSPESYAGVIVDWVEAAGALGENLPRIAAGRKSYVLVHQNGASTEGTRRYERFQGAARPHPGLTLLDEMAVTGKSGRASDAVRTLLDRFRHAGVVVTLDPGPWLDQAPNSLLHEQNKFATLGAAPPLWASLRDGRAAALVGPIDGDVGFAAMELGMRALVERKRLGVVRVIPSEIVTPENLDDFAKRYEAAAKP